MGEKPNLQSAFISSLQPHSTSRSRRSSINFSFSPLSTNFTNQSPSHCYHTQRTTAEVEVKLIVSSSFQLTQNLLFPYNQTLTKSNGDYLLGPHARSYRLQLVSIKTSSFDPKKEKKKTLRCTIFLLDFSKNGEKY